MKLPIADARTTWDYTLRLLRTHRGEFLLIAAMTMLSALAGLVGPWLLGRLVDDVRAGTTADHVRDLVLIAVAASLLRGGGA
jgi:ABC-type multidrug transport system fused ATPase/permease subunit